MSIVEAESRRMQRFEWQVVGHNHDDSAPTSSRIEEQEILF